MTNMEQIQPKLTASMPELESSTSMMFILYFTLVTSCEIGGRLKELVGIFFIKNMKFNVNFISKLMFMECEKQGLEFSTLIPNSMMHVLISHVIWY